MKKTLKQTSGKQMCVGCSPLYYQRDGQQEKISRSKSGKQKLQNDINLPRYICIQDKKIQLSSPGFGNSCTVKDSEEDQSISLVEVKYRVIMIKANHNELLPYSVLGGMRETSDI